MNSLFRSRAPEFQIYPSAFPFLIFLTSTFKILATICDISGEQCNVSEFRRIEVYRGALCVRLLNSRASFFAEDIPRVAGSEQFSSAFSSTV